LILPYSHRG